MKHELNEEMMNTDMTELASDLLEIATGGITMDGTVTSPHEPYKPCPKCHKWFPVKEFLAHLQNCKG